MGTEISLRVEGFAIDWAKNFRGVDHGHLFQSGDLTRLRSDQIDYKHAEVSEEDLEKEELAFAKELGKIIPRIRLLGYDLSYVVSEYQQAVKDRVSVDRFPERHLGFVSPSNPERYLEFPEFLEFVKARSIKELDAARGAGESP